RPLFPHYLAPPENMHADGLPKTPTRIAESTGRSTEFRAADFADWHPTRHEMLIRTRFADTFQIHQVKFPGGARRQMTFFKDSVAGASYSPVDGSYVVFSKDKGGNEFAQLYRFDLADGN